MSSTKVQHRKKKHVFKQRQSPFPVPIASVTREPARRNYWYQYTGQIQGDYVLVTHSGDISYLNKMGSFGKGLLSRGEPSVYKDLPYVHLPSAKHSEPDVVRVMRRRMYLKHMKWKKSHDLRLTNGEDGAGTDKLPVTSEDQEFDSDVDNSQQDFMHEEDFKSNTRHPETTHDTNTVPEREKLHDSSGERDPDIKEHHSNNIASSITSASQNSSLLSWKEEIANQKPHNDSWDDITSNQKSAAESWDTMEADEDFWASENVQNETSEPKDDKASDLFNAKSGSTKESALRSTRGKRTLVDSGDTLSSPIKLVKLHQESIKGQTKDLDKLTNYSSELSNLNIDDRDEKVCNSQNDPGNMDRDFNERLAVQPCCTHNAGDNDTDLENTDEKITTAKERSKYPVVTESNIDDSTEPQSSNSALSITSANPNSTLQSWKEEGVSGDLGESITSNQKSASETCDTMEADKDLAGEDVQNETSKLDTKLGNTEVVTKNKRENLERDFHEPLPIHPYCTSDVEDNDTGAEENDDKAIAAGEIGEYLVVDDSDIDDSTEPVCRKEKYTWIPVRKKEIFNFNEPLILSFEEAYFLSYGLGCLSVQDENQSSLTLTNLWCRFCEKPQFLPRYVAYHYFRSKGWVPKPSVLFGTDFILDRWGFPIIAHVSSVVYKVGPEFYHASYSVIVKTVYADSYEEVQGYNRKFTWTSFFGLKRITEQASKTLVNCYVIMPRDLREEEKRSPECISRFKIRLQTVHRWVSSREREKDKIIEDIT